MRTLLLFVFVLTFIATSFSSLAQSRRESAVVDCVNLTFPNGVATFVNNCPTKVNVSYCVQSSQSYVKCTKSFSAMTTISQGRDSDIPYYKSQGSGKVLFGACAYPAHPSKSGEDSFECR